MAFKVSFRKKINPALVVGLLVSFILVLFVGNNIIAQVDEIIDLNADTVKQAPFGSAFTFLGMVGNGYGMIGIIGFILAASLLLSIIKVQFR